MKRVGSTLIELLILIAIITILVALLLSAVMKIQEGEHRVRTHSNLMQLSLANHSCNDVYRRLPPMVGPFGSVGYVTTAGSGCPVVNGPATVHVHLLPYIESGNLYGLWCNGFGPGGLNGAAPKAGNNANASTPPNRDDIYYPFLSPQDFTQVNQGAAGQNYLANWRVYTDYGVSCTLVNKETATATAPNNGLSPSYPPDIVALMGDANTNLYGKASIPDTLIDGTSTTIAFATGYMQCGPEATCPNGNRLYSYFPTSDTFGVNGQVGSFFGYNMTLPSSATIQQGQIFQTMPHPSSTLCNSGVPQALSADGISVGMFDGSVRMIATSISVATWCQAVQPNDGTILGQANNDW
jgi:hypothetical protein